MDSDLSEYLLTESIASCVSLTGNIDLGYYGSDVYQKPFIFPGYIWLGSTQELFAKGKKSCSTSTFKEVI
jgi:hypothetical protein